MSCVCIFIKQRHKSFSGEFLFMRKVLWLWATIILFTAFASAQIPTKGNVFFGYSYDSQDTNIAGRANLSGWNGSLEGKVLPFVGIVADFSGHYGQETFPIACPAIAGITCSPKMNAHVHNVLFGPRVSVTAGKFTPFAHALAGASHISGSGSGPTLSDTSLGIALGGGIDYRLIPHVGWRTQVDLLQTRFFGNTQDNFRLSTGLTLRF
jgi:hypothetical protein